MQRKLDEIMNRLDRSANEPSSDSGKNEKDESSHGAPTTTRWHGEDSITAVPAYPEWSPPRIAERGWYGLSGMSCSGMLTSSLSSRWNPGAAGYFLDPDMWMMGQKGPITKRGGTKRRIRK